jgi:shikimate dehydrogenase
MIYRPAVTPLLSAAREKGATAVNGLGMLVAQGAISIDIWSDSAQVVTPRDIMLQAALDEMERLRYPDAGAQS